MLQQLENLRQVLSLEFPCKLMLCTVPPALQTREAISWGSRSHLQEVISCLATANVLMLGTSFPAWLICVQRVKLQLGLL